MGQKVECVFPYIRRVVDMSEKLDILGTDLLNT